MSALWMWEELNQARIWFIIDFISEAIVYGSASRELTEDMLKWT